MSRENIGQLSLRANLVRPTTRLQRRMYRPTAVLQVHAEADKLFNAVSAASK